MKNLFRAATVAEVKERVSALRPESERVWGKMNVAQRIPCGDANRKSKDN